MNEELKFDVEVENTETHFRHRLACSNGKVTQWASYTHATYLEGMVSITPFFHGGSGVEIVTAEKYCELTCICEKQP